METDEKNQPKPVLKECSKCNRKVLIPKWIKKCKFCQVNTLEVCK